MADLKITLLQASLEWEKPEVNILHFERLLKNVKMGSTDLILLPEMFTTGFTMNAKSVAESMNGNAVSWMKKTAKDKKAVICGSLVIKEKGKYYNRLIWAEPGGKILTYDKRHLFSMAKENKTYTPGKKRLIVKLNGWNICPLVCYDLRFPVWSRSKGEIDLLLYVANWPDKRSYAWKQLLIARSIENQCYVAGLNRVGVDGKAIPYNGDSVVLDPLGAPLSKITPGKTTISTISISRKQLMELRKSFPVANYADKFKLRN